MKTLALQPDALTLPSTPPKSRFLRASADSRNDLTHGDEHIKDVLPLTKAQQVELTQIIDKLIDDALTGQDMEKIQDGVNAAPDELQDLLVLQHVPDINRASLYEVLMLARAANKFIEAWYDGMVLVVASDAEKIVRRES